MASILVTDGEQRSALALVRALGRAGHEVHVGSSRRHSLAGSSRYAAARHQLPDPLLDPPEFAKATGEIVGLSGIEIAIPVTEAAILALLPDRHRLGATIPFPDLDAFHRLRDKRWVLACAEELGIAVPKQTVLADRAAEAALDVDEIPFPLVLKPARSVGEVGGRREKLGVLHAADVRQLRRHLDRFSAAAYPLLVQQRVVGPGIGVFLLLWAGELRAVFAHRRLREKPPSGGVSVYCESVVADPRLVARSRELLERLGWCGVAMVEYKRDESTGEPYLMEINGRFWGSLQLAIDAGVDFPNLLVRCAVGERPEPVTEYRTGLRSRWWWGDVDHLIARLVHSPTDLALPPGTPGRIHAVREFFRLWRPGDRNEIFRVRDPVPLVRETIDWLQRR